MYPVINYNGELSFPAPKSGADTSATPKVIYSRHYGVFPSGGIVYERGDFRVHMTPKDIASAIELGTERGECDLDAAEKFCSKYQVSHKFKKTLLFYLGMSDYDEPS
ncbi:MAG: hypothetical protein LUG13_10100 [Oscillospiraceae bacterium]|nr:hypothetical protein [Oscillospiraceae bacterium]